jgi:hypothetical protein
MVGLRHLPLAPRRRLIHQNRLEQSWQQLETSIEDEAHEETARPRLKMVAEWDLLTSAADV